LQDDRESAMDFSIDSDQRTAFKDLNCVAYDLGLDLEMAHPVYRFSSDRMVFRRRSPCRSSNL